MSDENNPEPEKPRHPKKRKAKRRDTILYWSIALIAAAAVIFIVLFFVAKNYYSEPEYPTITYNNWEFKQIAGMWWFQWQKGSNLYNIPLRFNPYESNNVSIAGKLNSILFNSKNYIYITFDLSNTSSQNLAMLALAATELTQNIATAIDRTPIAACTNKDSYACEGRQIKTCSDAEEPVIFMQEGGKTAITFRGSCISITGTGFELVRAVDRLLYHWYRIMPI